MSVKNIKIEYNIVSNTIPILKKQLYNSLSNGDFVKLALDFTSVEKIDSVGLGCLISLHNNLTNDDKILEITNISNSLHEVLRNMQMDRLFEIKKRLLWA